MNGIPATPGRDRFAFGKNWRRFLESIDEERIRRAESSLRDLLGVPALLGSSFLDAGCGSGLFSLAARRLGARVHSFDFDPASVSCARELRRRFRPDDSAWTVEEGSVLDEGYLLGLGAFDVVYSWGVLHHTGDLWRALDLVRLPLASHGLLAVALYNDRGKNSDRWRLVKRLYIRHPLLRPLLLSGSLLRLWGRTLLKDALRGKPLSTWRGYAGDSRGMSAWRDLVDWVGGYPYETARPDEVFAFGRERGMVLVRSVLNPGLGCNEFVFRG